MSKVLASSATAALSPRQNHVLAALPEPAYERLLPHLQLEPLPIGGIVYRTGDERKNALFPVAGIIADLRVLQNGSTGAIAVVGREGAVGVSLLMGGGKKAGHTVVISEGFAYRIKGAPILEEFERSRALRERLLRYTRALMTQITQTGVCYKHHSIHQQVCRWLLLSMDRLDSSDLEMTQELIAIMLGVRREGVSEAASQLQADGIIHYGRGRISVLDRQKLEARVCECYEVVRKEYDGLLRETPDPAAQSEGTVVSLALLSANAGAMLSQDPGEYVALGLAAAITFHQVHRGTRDELAQWEYDDALNLAAVALARLVPIYTLDDPSQGRVALAIDLAGQRFVNGATELHCRRNDRKFERLSIRRSDLLSATSLIKRRGFDFGLA